MELICTRCKKRMAVVFVTRMEGDKTINEGLCLKCAKELGIKPVNDMMEKMGMTEEDLDNFEDQLMTLDSESAEGNFEPGGAPAMPFLENLFGKVSGAGGEKSAAGEKEKKKGAKKEEQKESKRKFLDSYCDDLSKKAREGLLDNIIGREKEISRVIQILNRRTKNNPCLIGEPGVGKTAVAEGIAQKIARGEVPAKLLDKEVHILDLTALVAGTQFRGQFESRVKGLVEEVKREGNIILFIDEVHNLVGAGDSEGSMNAANILKPALSRGEVQVIGATTFNEYRKYIEKDSALERRFQPVTINEPSVEEAVEIVRGVKGYYESYHGVKVSDAMARKMVTLSERYIFDRFLPDKAIDLLDEACSCAELRNKELEEYRILEKKIAELKKSESEKEKESEGGEVDYEGLAIIKADILKLSARRDELKGEVEKAVVTDDDVARAIELWTGIPASKIKETELKKVAGLEETLKKKIVGQDEAVELVAKAVRRSRVQLSAVKRPASFIFVGPTGVGKTELVKTLAAELSDSADPLIRLDMSEFMEKFSVSRIVGSPPGYVGYDEAGQLTEKVRRRPYSVILFDEIEKAHPDVMNILLQILDEGKIADAHGRVVSFENTIIIMTSNAGSERRENALGFAKEAAQVAKDKAYKALSEFLRPEFLGRVDEIVVFGSLTEENFKGIAKIMLEELKKNLDEKGIGFVWNDAVVDYIAHKAFGNKSGARDIRKITRKEIEDEICMILLQSENYPANVAVELENDTLKIVAE